MTQWQYVIASAAIQLVITGGTALAAAATADGVLTQVEWVVAIIGGLVAGAKDAQAYLAKPPKA